VELQGGGRCPGANLLRFVRYLLVVALATLALLGPAWAQGPEHEVLDEKAGVIPVHARLSPWPPAVGKAHFVIDVADGGPPPPTAPYFERVVSIIADMPAMPGMGSVSSHLRPAGRIPGGSRWEGELEFSMDGRWRLRFIVGTINGRFQMVRLVDVGENGGLVTEGSPEPPSTPLPEEPPGPSPSGAASAAPEPSATPPAALEIMPLAPPHVGDNRIRFKLAERPDPRDRVMVSVDMAGMAMAIPPVEARHQADGTWEAQVPLSMSGLWHVTVQAGRFRGRGELKVPSPRTLAFSRGLLYVSLVVGVPFAIWWGVRRRPMGPFVASAALVIATFGAGAIIQSYWPPDTSMGMEMDMNAPDMGMSSMSAPLPVIEAKVQRLHLLVTRKYPARIVAGSQTIVTAPVAGLVERVVESGVGVPKGTVVARVAGRTVVATARGVIDKRFVEPGTVVAAAAPIVSIGDIKHVRVEAEVPTTDLGMIGKGAPVDVLFGGKAVVGKVSEVSNLAQGDVFRVEAVIDNEAKGGGGMAMGLPVVPKGPKEVSGIFALGQDVTMRATLLDLPNVLSVPLDAVQTGVGQPSVYVIDEVAGTRVAHRKPVTTGASSDTYIEIVSGLREGQKVVAVADDTLQDGSIVTLGAWGTGAYRELLLPRDDDMNMNMTGHH
jgi:multidrug efflux pump subunit AcrA (membrane-fusion protein)